MNESHPSDQPPAAAPETPGAREAHDVTAQTTPAAAATQAEAPSAETASAPSGEAASAPAESPVPSSEPPAPAAAEQPAAEHAAAAQAALTEHGTAADRQSSPAPPAAEQPPASPGPEPVAAEPPAASVDSVPAAPDDAVPHVPATSATPPQPAEGDAAVVTSEPSVKAPAPPDPRQEERRRRAQAAWERVVAAKGSGEILTGSVTAAVKGGLLVDVGGIRGFLPASQVRVQQGTALETLVKTKVPLKVIDVDQARRRIVVSHRRAVEEERRAKRAEVLQSLAVGQVREGTVVRLTDFGAFVDLGGIDGLIPMRELAFERVEKTSDVVSVGEKLPVEVLRIDEGGKKISLSRKNALPDPWRDNAEVLRHGKTVEGKVVAKEPRLQVELAPGIVGTVRESDADPSQYEIGEAIEVTVRRADRATRRITLSTAHGASAAPPPSNSGGFAPLGVELGRR